MKKKKKRKKRKKTVENDILRVVGRAGKTKKAEQKQ